MLQLIVRVLLLTWLILKWGMLPGNGPCMQEMIRETCEVIPAHDLITPAWDLSCNHRITIYDALFVAASIHCDAPLVTADKKLAGAVSTTCPVIYIE